MKATKILTTINKDYPEKMKIYQSGVRYGRKQGFKRGQWSILWPLIYIAIIVILIALTIKKINL